MAPLAQETPTDNATSMLIACDERFRPYRHLAVRVLARAVLDVMDPAGSPTDRESARVFFAGSVMLRHWCHVAALNPDQVRRCVERFTTGFAVVADVSPRTGPFGETDLQ